MPRVSGWIKGTLCAHLRNWRRLILVTPSSSGAPGDLIPMGLYIQENDASIKPPEGGPGRSIVLETGAAHRSLCQREPGHRHVVNVHDIVIGQESCGGHNKPAPTMLPETVVFGTFFSTVVMILDCARAVAASTPPLSLTLMMALTCCTVGLVVGIIAFGSILAMTKSKGPDRPKDPPGPSG